MLPEQKLRLRFTGRDGSLGYRRGQVYDLVVRYRGDGVMVILKPYPCPCGSWVAFWRNWETLAG